MSFTEQEIEEFKSEARELLDMAEKKLLALDMAGAEGAKVEYKSCYDSVFRSFHNLKGASGMMEMHELQSHTHELENILMGLKEKGELSKENIGFFLKGIDGARTLLDGESIQFDYSLGTNKNTQESLPSVKKELSVEKPAEEPAEELFPSVPALTGQDTNNALGEFFAECDEIIARISADLKKIESGDVLKDLLNNLYRDMHSLKGAAYLFGFPSVGDIAHAMESSMEPVRSFQKAPDKPLLDMLYQAVSAVEVELELIKTNNPDLKNAQAASQLCKKLIEWAQDQETNVSQADSQAQPSSVTKSSNQENAPAVKTEAANKETANKEADASSSIRVPVSLLDNLMTLMGEMVLVRNQVLQFSSRSEDLEFLMLSKRLNSVTSEIQGEMLKTRMQAIGNILSKFHRVVRDLSQELKKDINLTVIGAETELDKTLLEAIKDPLTHIVRNSCDHGIETPAIRKKNAKPETGTISIKSYHEGGQVVIEISDDGKGLNKDVLIKKALEKGLINSAQVSKMSDKEIFDLIFAPGFSTAAAVTNLSGRGVGMDVVRTNIEKIGGTVELSSIPGSGTNTKLKIPLTLAIVPALIVKSGHGAYAIPQIKLEQLVRVDQASSENKIEYLMGAPVFRLRGSILSLVDLNKVIGLTSRKIEENTVSNIAVLNADGCLFGLIVDEVLDTADIVVKPLTKLLKSLQVYSGATILGDGGIALILDVLGLSKIANIGTDKKNKDDAKKEKRSSESQDFLIVRLNSPTKLAVVLGFVHRLEEFKRSAIEISGNQRVIRYGSDILPLISCNEQLNLKSATHSESASELVPVVVIKKAGMLFGLEVNEIIDTLSTDLEANPSVVPQKGIFGNLNTPEELIVVIDPFELINNAFPEMVVAPISVDKTSSAIDNSMTAKRILLVEDTVFFRRAVADVLVKAGHTVSTYEDGKEALNALTKSPDAFDLVISDIEMPRMNGFELATAIRANKAICHLPMLALSSRADKIYLDQGIEAGFDMYLEKLKPVILLDAVSKLSVQKRRAS
jgi:two-component system chemotaxis sensor kinase CheA